ncbi:hypothetical protein JXB02_06880 [Candidatus Woesearchaeota archaeon]|nr:hypothetical protein [Candidatus Woesearchaeota archaeon]
MPPMVMHAFVTKGRYGSDADSRIIYSVLPDILWALDIRHYRRYHQPKRRGKRRLSDTDELRLTLEHLYDDRLLDWLIDGRGKDDPQWVTELREHRAEATDGIYSIMPILRPISRIPGIHKAAEFWGDYLFDLSLERAAIMKEGRGILADLAGSASAFDHLRFLSVVQELYHPSHIRSSEFRYYGDAADIIRAFPFVRLAEPYVTPMVLQYAAQHDGTFNQRIATYLHSMLRKGSGIGDTVEARISESAGRLPGWALDDMLHYFSHVPDEDTLVAGAYGGLILKNRPIKRAAEGLASE